ncbi:MAG: DUF3800 domain-containing protein [Bacillota bacterium]|nr:DUF3800 domain-containing protein [Bacillota bacterium]
MDESGTHTTARYFVVAGLAVFERETYFLAKSLDDLQAKYFPEATENIPFHASSLRAPESRVPAPYDALTIEDRRQLVTDIYQVVAGSRARVFAVAMEKAAIDGDCYERGFEEIVNRFDRFLGRIFRDRGDQQRGLIVVAESSYRENLELLARNIAAEGHRWGETHCLADIPYFAPAKSTRLLQLADFVANAVFGRYESGYSRDFDQIAIRLDQDEGRLHGLVHIALDRRSCYCPACVTRRTHPRLLEIDELPET